MTDCLKLKKSNCKNCYKCIRHCPVKSIRFSGNQAHIENDECILCGQCVVICPQKAKEITDDTEKVKMLIQSGDPVVASLAPSFAANYDGVGISAMREALQKLGFYYAEETAIGATIVKKEYDRMLKEDNRDIIISSCCHSVNLLIQKHYPNEIKYLADILSPMQAHCIDIKRRIRGAKTVFIGPCVAKKDEAQRYDDIVDAVMTFEELSEWMKCEDISPRHERDHEENSKARLFPTVGGILKTMALDTSGYTYMAVDGAENCIATLKDIEAGGIHNCFIEMSACTGSCIGGPVMEKHRRSPVRDFQNISQYAGSSDFIVNQPSKEELSKKMEYIGSKLPEPREYEITEILEKMGKNRPDDELNCGSCGYNTCREKAIAIYQGKADISMCLPFLKDKAETFSDTIVNNSPNGLILLNEMLEVQQINKAACSILKVRMPTDMLGESIVRLLDPKDFTDVLKNGANLTNDRRYLAEYDSYVEMSILHDKEYHVLICIMRDITQQQKQRERRESINLQTVETADKVVDKQMRIVQEIASLLGETAAETKIALTKLKESIKDE